MVETGFYALALLAIIAILFDTGIRIRLIKHDTARDKLAWLHRNSTEVYDTYQALFPHSYIPRALRFFFWTVVILALLIVVIGLVSKPR